MKNMIALELETSFYYVKFQVLQDAVRLLRNGPYDSFTYCYIKGQLDEDLSG